MAEAAAAAAAAAAQAALGAPAGRVPGTFRANMNPPTRVRTFVPKSKLKQFTKRKGDMVFLDKNLMNKKQEKYNEQMGQGAVIVSLKNRDGTVGSTLEHGGRFYENSTGTFVKVDGDRLDIKKREIEFENDHFDKIVRLCLHSFDILADTLNLSTEDCTTICRPGGLNFFDDVLFLEKLGITYDDISDVDAFSCNPDIMKNLSVEKQKMGLSKLNLLVRIIDPILDYSQGTAEHIADL